jgi:hypothetical protein
MSDPSAHEPAGGAPVDQTYTLLGAGGTTYQSNSPGTLGGHRKNRIYGQLNCPAAFRAIAAGGYTSHRVFFADEITAVASGYRPCNACMPKEYRAWKARA